MQRGRIEGATRKASGCLIGLALGDALGAPTEFLTFEEILQKYPPCGPTEPQGNPARVTDDTQMTLAVGEALLAAWQEGPLIATSLEPHLRLAFVEWLESPENNRAPGMTCLQACEKLAQNLPWREATIEGSKGCGANMRVAPVGLLPLGQHGLTVSTRAALAQFQAALTHGHPTALAASDLTAFAIADLAKGGEPEGLCRRLMEYAQSQREVYHADWLGPLWERPYTRAPEEFIARGWEELLRTLSLLERALTSPQREEDPCLVTGAGWSAEEALATGLLCFLLSPKEPLQVLRRAATTSGDSDSIASLAGAFAGAYHGLSAWPEDWLSRIEYRDRLLALGGAWDF